MFEKNALVGGLIDSIVRASGDMTTNSSSTVSPML